MQKTKRLIKRKPVSKETAIRNIADNTSERVMMIAGQILAGIAANPTMGSFTFGIVGDKLFRERVALDIERAIYTAETLLDQSARRAGDYEKTARRVWGEKPKSNESMDWDLTT